MLVAWILMSLWIARPHQKQFQIRADAVDIYPATSLNRAIRPSVKDKITNLDSQYSDRRYGPLQYSFRFDNTHFKNKKLAVYVPASGGDIQALINGIRIARGQEQAGILPGMGTVYLAADIPEEYLHKGENRMTFIVRPDKSRTGIAQIYLGPKPDLQQMVAHHYKREKILTNTFILATIAGLALSLLGLLSGLQARFYGTGLLISLPLLAIALWKSPFLNTQTWPDYRVITALYLPALAGVAYLWFLAYKKATLRIWQIPVLSIAFVGLSIALLIPFLPMRPPAPVFLAALSHFSILPLFLLLFPVQLQQDLSRYHSRLATIQEDLARKEQALIREQTRSARLAERQRLARDMHDGIGGQLLSLLLRVRSGRVDLGQIEQDIKTSITDLRLIVDSMDNVGNNMQAALQTFKERAEAQCEAANIELTWQQENNLDFQFGNSRSILHIYRFLQEALSNALRHSGADRICIKILHPCPEVLTLEVTDTGKGLGSKAGEGRGLENMKARAEKLGGEFVHTEVEQGTGVCVRLTLPLNKVTDKAVGGPPDAL